MGAGEQAYSVGRIFEGPYLYEDGEVPTFDRLILDLRHLDSWVARDGLSEEGVYDDRRNLDGWDLSVRRLPTLTAEIGPGVAASIRHGFGVTGGREARALTQNHTIGLDLDSPCELPEITAYATLIQDLVSIATTRVAEFDAFRVSHPDFEQDQGGRKLRSFLDLYVEWIAKEEPDKKARSADFAVPFAAIGGIEGVATWLRTAWTFRSLVTRVMATRYFKMYTDDRFFNVIAPLEGLHRKLTGKKSKLATRLRDMVDRAGTPFLNLIPDIDIWVSKVRAERNDHAHQLGNAAQTTGAQRYYLAESVYWLFVMCLFRECRYSDKVLAQLKRPPNSYGSATDSERCSCS